MAELILENDLFNAKFAQSNLRRWEIFRRIKKYIVESEIKFVQFVAKDFLHQAIFQDIW